jgi:hypothetical protein
MCCTGSADDGDSSYLGYYLVNGQIGKTTKVINDDFETIELRFNNAEFGANIQVLIKKINAE